MKRKTLLTIPLLLALVVLSQSLTSPSTAAAEPHIYITDASIIDTGLTYPDTFTISIRTNYTGSDIWGYEFTLTYNPLVLNGSSISNGDLITDPPYTTTFSPGTLDNTTGEASLTITFFTVALVGGVPVKPFNTTSGTGNSILANVTFQVVGIGDTPITLGAETRLIGYDSVGDDTYDIVNAQLDLGNIGHGYFSNVDPPPVHDVAVVSGTTNATALGPYKGRPVEVNATVKNNGTVRERLDVSIYWRVISDDWLIYNEIVDLNSGVSYNISFVWDTNTTFGYGVEDVTVKVREVWNSTITDNNQLAIDSVHVRMLGNIDGDGDVDRDDFVDFASTYNPPSGYNVEADFNFDGKQDAIDFMILLGNRGRHE